MFLSFRRKALILLRFLPTLLLLNIIHAQAAIPT
jgi:hypothetical protein